MVAEQQQEGATSAYSSSDNGAIAEAHAQMMASMGLPGSFGAPGVASGPSQSSSSSRAGGEAGGVGRDQGRDRGWSRGRGRGRGRGQGGRGGARGGFYQAQQAPQLGLHAQGQGQDGGWNGSLAPLPQFRHQGLGNSDHKRKRGGGGGGGGGGGPPREIIDEEAPLVPLDQIPVASLLRNSFTQLDPWSHLQ